MSFEKTKIGIQQLFYRICEHKIETVSKDETALKHGVGNVKGGIA
jgi:hypothetical protein